MQKGGGVGLFIKNSLASQNRPDLALLPECIEYEIHLNREKHFFDVIYKCPSQEFENFTANLS